MTCCMLTPNNTTPPVIDPNQRGRPIITSGPTKTLRTDTGQIIRAGAARIENNTSTPPFLNSTWANGRALGLNTMRCGVQSVTLSLSLSTLLNNIDLVVEKARVNRMYCMLGYFAAKPGTYDDAIATNEANWKAFWSAAAPRYKNKPWVIYEAFNEPWAWGQVSSATPALKASLKAIYDVIRAGAPDTVIVWPSPANLSPSASQYVAFMQGIDALGAGPVDWTRTVLGHHYYNQTYKLAGSGSLNNATDGGRAGLLALAAQYPLFCTETNWYVEAIRDVLIDALDLYEALGIAWTLLRYPGQTNLTDEGSRELAPHYLEPKIDQLRARGFVIPVE